MTNQNLPKTPTAVPLPSLSAEVTGPGVMFDSAPSQAKGLDLEHFRYATKEYFASGTADGKPYTTRVVVRMPRDASKFSGLVLAESITRLPSHDERCRAEARARRVLGDEAYSVLAWVAVTINAFNRLNVGFRVSPFVPDRAQAA